MLKAKLEWTIPRNFLEALGGYFAFRFATLKLLLHIAITNANGGRLYELLDTSICYPVMISPCKQ